MINVRGLQRNVKNVVKNYTDAQVKVREATSNDPWGPPSTLMAEIADLTHNVVAFSEIMQMIWKRLNDHGKNWRHVYKALSLLDYLIKTGSEKVAQQCRDNIFAIQTLKDFQYFEENKDQGLNVREKSKALVALLKDEEKLRQERIRALKAKERFAQSGSFMTNSASTETIPKTSSSYHEGIGTSDSAAAASSSSRANSSSSAVNTELEQARPQTIGEEELQLQLALAMSKEEAEAEERQRKNDDLRLQLALNESEKEKQKKKTSALDDLLQIDLAPSASASSVPATNHQLDIWGMPISDSASLTNGTTSSNNLFGASSSTSNDPWSSGSVNASASMPAAAAAVSSNNLMGNSLVDQSDIWGTSNSKNALESTEITSNDPWQSISSSSASAFPNTYAQNDPWSSSASTSSTSNKNQNPSSIGSVLQPTSTSALCRKTPESFLGPNSNLVNLDALVSKNTNSSVGAMGANPFAASSTSTNPFQAAKPPQPSMNQLRSQTSFPVDSLASASSFGGLMSTSSQPAPLQSHQTQLNSLSFSASSSSSNNPFAM